jgi:hypothetical protein
VVMTASPLLPSAPRGRARWLVTAFLVVLLGLQVGAAPPAAAAEPTTYQGMTYPTAGPAATEDKPQSKLGFGYTRPPGC